MTVWNKLGLPFERSDEHKEHRISKRIKNTSHNTRPLAKMANPFTWNLDQRTRITVYGTHENICTIVLLSNEDSKLPKYEKVCSKQTGLPNVVCSPVSSFCTKKGIFAKDFSISFKTVNKLKLNIGYVTRALILPASRSPDEFRNLLCNFVREPWSSEMNFVFIICILKPNTLKLFNN